MSKLFDVIVFGASGFTGVFVVEELVHNTSLRSSLTIAIAGRSQSRLLKVLDDCSKSTGLDWVKNIPVLEVDVSDVESLSLMAKQAKVVLNCVGPYILYGKEVVQACVNAGTHHLDVSGEPQYLEQMQLDFSRLAEQNKAYVVGSCAFLSAIPELGVQFTEQHFKGSIIEIESYFVPTSKEFYPINVGTWNSLLENLATRSNLASIRQRLYPNSLPKPKPKQTKRNLLFYAKEINKWCVPFHSSDESVIYRGQRYFFDHMGKSRMIQYSSYLALKSFFGALLLLCGLIFLAIAVRIPPLRRLLQKYPDFLTFGVISSKGPTREQLKNGAFSCYFMARGWSSDSQQDGPPDTKMITRIDGPEPGYITTAICLVQAAFTILDECENMPNQGGVYPAAAAFHNTGFLNRMQRKLKFSILEEDSKEK